MSTHKKRMAVAVAIASCWAAAHAQGFTFVKSVKTYTALTAKAPLRAAFPVAPEDCLYAEHTPQELSEYALPGVQRLLRESSLKLTAGASAELPFFRATFSATFGQAQIKDWGAAWQQWADKPSLSYGIMLTASKASLGLRSNVPYGLQVLAGTLSRGGSVTRLKNPSLSSVAALYSSSPAASGVSAALPGFSSTAAARSVAALAVPSPKLPFLPQVGVVLTQGGEWYASVSQSLKTSRKTAIDLAVTVGASTYGRTGSTAWFRKEKPFATGQFFALEAECSVRNWKPAKRLLFSVFVQGALYQNPFGGASPVLKAQGAATLGNARLNAGLMLARPGTVCAGGTTLGAGWQAYANPQYTLALRGGTVIRTGITVFAEPESLGIKAAVQGTGLRTAVTAQCAADVDMPRGVPPHASKTTVKAAYTRMFAPLSSTTELSATFTRSAKRTYGATQKFSFKKPPLTALSAGLSVTAGPSPATGTLSLGASFSGSSKKLSWTGKLTLQATF